MSITEEQGIEARLTDLDRRLRELETVVVPLPRRPARPARLPAVRPASSAAAVRPEPVPAVQPAPTAGRAAAPPPRPIAVEVVDTDPEASSWWQAPTDLVGGRVLAWLGGAAVLLGIALFLVLAISRGWLGIDARVVLAGVGSAALVGGGVWLHARRGRTEASVAVVGVGAAGLFATLVAASAVYHLISPLLAMIASMLVGGFAAMLAIRWAGRAIGAIGLLGALVSPVLVGAPPDLTTVGLVAVGGGTAAFTAVKQRWGWLGVAIVLACAWQWGSLVLGGQPVAVDLAVLVGFAAIGLVAAIGIHADSERLAPSSAALAALSACLAAVIGAVAIDDRTGALARELWLAGLAITYAAIGLSNLRAVRIAGPLRRLLIVLGVILADVAFGLGATGVWLVVGWAGTAVMFSWFSRRAQARPADAALLSLGLGVHVALALIRALIEAPPAALGGEPELLPLLCLASVAASCLASAHILRPRREVVLGVLNALGLASVAYLTAQALAGPPLVAAWAFEALALATIARHQDDRFARYGAGAFLALALLHTLVGEAPPTALLTGADSLSGAAIALCSIAVALGLGARAYGRARPGARAHARAPWLLSGAAGALLYLVSIAIITAFQPVGGDAGSTVLDLSVRQEGQVLLSACWSLVGVAGLIIGLRTNRQAVRNLALGLLLVTVAKVFLYDLATLTSAYRVASFIALGLLLLAAAYAYQRLRPPPVPDMRTVHRSQR